METVLRGWWEANKYLLKQGKGIKTRQSSLGRALLPEWV